MTWAPCFDILDYEVTLASEANVKAPLTKEIPMNFTLKKAERNAPGAISASGDQHHAIAPLPEESLDRAGRVRRRVLAIALPITALTYMSAEAFNPKGTDQVITSTSIALKVLPIAAKHSSQLYLSGSLTEIALAGIVISYFAVATLVRRRSAALATVAAILGAAGAFCGIVANVLGGINLATASSAHLAKFQAARFLAASFNSGAGKAFFDVYAFSELLAPVLMAVALWRSRLVPRWLSVVFLAGFGLAEQTASVGVVRAVALMALFVVAMVLLAVRVWRSAALPVQVATEPSI
jgi:hypothetical protein